ncbi:DNA-binding response regulator [Paenibacillus chartarius]|uniref:DNA-binding response regulator n=1 Tax=Paenibacillus chartarius TaxID=747481 RepID=A0ABV6DKU0_9BACL
MGFTKAYELWLEKHMRSRSGEVLGRLEGGLGHAERLFLELVWRPLFGHFNGLIPEYEVNDFRDGKRYIDFVFIWGPMKLAIEIDGFGPHLLQISRSQFTDQLLRQNHLLLDDWQLLRFSYDLIKERPRTCQQMIQQFMGKWFGISMTEKKVWKLEEREMLRLIAGKGGRLTPQEAASVLHIHAKKARKIMHSLREKGALLPGGSGTKKIYSYVLSPNVTIEDLR